MTDDEVTEATILDDGSFDRKAVMASLKSSEGRKALLKDETMEPHIHLAILLMIVAVMTIVIMFVQ